MQSSVKDPLFTVVIPTFNRADLLREALESVLAQTCEDFEVIVVDNHSTDGTLELVRSFHDPRLRAVQVHNNGVIAVSRNRAVLEARAPLVAFLDSDDRWHADKLDRSREEWAKDPELGMVTHHLLDVSGGRVIGERRTASYRGDVYRALLLQGNRVYTSATAVRKRYLDEVGGFSEDPELAGVEDYDLWLRLARVCRFHFLHEVLGELRIHSSSHSAAVPGRLGRSLHLLELHAKLLQREGTPLPRAILRRQKATRLTEAAGRATTWWGGTGCLAYCLGAIRQTPVYWKTYARVGRSLKIRARDTVRQLLG